MKENRMDLNPKTIKHLDTNGKRSKMPEITDKLANYILSKSYSPSKHLAAVEEMAKDEVWGFMATSKDQIGLLSMLVKLTNAKNILEVGCYLGHSAIGMASSFTAKGTLLSLEIDEKWANIASENIKKANLDKVITVKRGNAIDSLCELQKINNKDNLFDFIFIDADKVNCLNYYQSCLPLLKEKSIMVIDNVLWRGKIADLSISCERSNAIRKLNDYVFNDARVESTILTISDGMLLIRKK